MHASLSQYTLPYLAAEQSGIASEVVGYVLANVAEEITLDDLAESVGMTRFAFSRRFQRECGLSPMRWLWTFRAVLAAEMITADPFWSLTDVAFTCGFSSSAHFSRAFKEAVGVVPSVHKRDAVIKHPQQPSQRGLPGDFAEEVAVRAVARAWLS